MAYRYNQAGREIVADRFIELRPRNKRLPSAVSNISSQLQQQQISKDLDALKDQLNDITSDGVITSYEKQGLQREWSALQSAYTNVAERFQASDDLKQNASYIALRNMYDKLAELMSDIFADMSTDYILPSDIESISKSFSDIYQQLNVCQTVLNGITDFERTYTIQISGVRDVLNGTQITAGIYRNGVLQQNSEFVDGNNYSWKRIDSSEGWEEKHGQSLYLTLSDLPVSPCRFSVTWEDKEEQGSTLSIVFEVQYGTIKEYTWSNALTSDGLASLGDGSWSTTVPIQPDGVLYLWRRESSDNRKTWQYFRETGEQGIQGDKGDTGAQGPQGPQGETGTAGVSVTDVVAEYVVTDSEDDKPLDSASWSTDIPPRQVGQVLWTRSRVEYSDGTYTYTSAMPVTGDAGDAGDGASPKFYYKYTKTDDMDAYKTGATLLLWHGRAINIKGTTLIVGNGEWSEHVPEGEQYKDDYLWMKVVYPDGTEDHILMQKEGKPAYDIKIIPSNTTYQMSSRGTVLADQKFTFTVEKKNITETVKWQVEPDPEYNENDISAELDADNPEVLHVTVKTGTTLEGFTVTAYTEVIAVSDVCPVAGVKAGEPKPVYLKIYPQDPNGAYPIYSKASQSVIDNNGAVWPETTSEGTVIEGDYLIYKCWVVDTDESTVTSSTKWEPLPFRCEWDDDANDYVWKPLQYSTANNWSEIMGTILGDMTSFKDNPVTTSSAYAYFQQMGVYVALIENLFSNIIKLTGAIYGGAYDADGNNTTDGNGFHLSALTGILQAIGVVLKKADINGQLTATDDTGILLKTTSLVSSDKIEDSGSNAEDRYLLWNASNYCIIDGMPSDYFKISGYSEWFKANTYKVFDFEYARYNFKGESSEFANDYSAAQYYGRYILGAKTLNASSGDTSYEFTAPASSSDITVLLLYGPADGVSWIIPSIIVGVNGASVITKNIEDYNRIGSIDGIDFSAGDTIQIQLGSFSIFRSGRCVIFLLWTGGPKAPTYASGLDQISGNIKYETTGYNYLFLEDEHDVSSNANGIALPENLEKVPRAVYSLNSANKNLYAKYSGPTLSFYNAKNGSLICTSAASVSTLYDEGFSLYSDYYRLFYGLRTLPDGTYILNKSESYIRTQSQQSVQTITITSSSLGRMVTFYSGYDSGEIKSLKDYADELIPEGTAYSLRLTSSVRGILTASIMPADDSASIGNSAERYDVYAKDLNGHDLVIDGDADIGSNTSDVLIRSSGGSFTSTGDLVLNAGDDLRLVGNRILWNGLEVYNDNGTLKVR